jgi:hypothetical protein
MHLQEERIDTISQNLSTRVLDDLKQSTKENPTNTINLTEIIKMRLFQKIEYSAAA